MWFLVLAAMLQNKVIIRHCTINVFICVYTNKEKNMFNIVQVQIFNLCLSVGTHIVHITPLVYGTVEVENCLFFLVF